METNDDSVSPERNTLSGDDGCLNWLVAVVVVSGVFHGGILK